MPWPYKFKKSYHPNVHFLKSIRNNWVIKNSCSLFIIKQIKLQIGETHPKIDQESVTGTIIFLELIIEFWKIVNVKCLGVNLRYRKSLVM